MEQKYSGVKKNGKGNKHNRKAKWINSMKKELQRLEEDTEAIIHLESLRATLKNYRIRKCQAVRAYMESGFKNSCLSTID